MDVSANAYDGQELEQEREGISGKRLHNLFVKLLADRFQNLISELRKRVETPTGNAP